MKRLSALIERVPPDEMEGVDAQVLSRQISGVIHRESELEKNDIFVNFNPQSEAPKIPDFYPMAVKQKVTCRNPLLIYHQLEKSSADIARFLYEDVLKDLRLIAVTGTNGKSTVVDYCRQMAEVIWPSFKPASLGTLGYRVGDFKKKLPNTTPFPLDLYRTLGKIHSLGSSMVFMEASSHGLAEDRLQGLEFEHGAFTNISRDHLDYHGTLEEYSLAKAKLLTLCKGTAVLNRDCLHVSQFKFKESFSYSLENTEADVYVTQLEQSSDGYCGEIQIGKTKKLPFKMKAYGRHNVSNALCAASLLVQLGAPMEEIAPLFSELKAPKGRLDELNISVPGKVIVDYAHTPDALENAISALREHFPDWKIRVLFGCGGDRDVGKRSIMGGIAAVAADEVILTSDNPRSEDPNDILDDIISGIRGASYKRIPDRLEALEWALKSQKERSVLLIAGKGHEDTQTLGDKKIPFDEYEICLRISQK